MRYAGVVPDIPTRALDGAFDYAIPEGLEHEALVGSTVLVTFSGRLAVGYVSSVSDGPSSGLDPARIRPIDRVLANPAFDERASELARWMANEYAAPLADCYRLLLPPGQTVRVTRAGEGSPWELVCEKAGPVDDRWASLTEEGRSFVPAARAARQREVVAALSAGPVRLAELCALSPGARGAADALERRGMVSFEHRRRLRGGEGTTLSSAVATRPEHLTPGQEGALAAIDGALAARGGVIVVDGVTGSGKTEVYLEAIERVLAQGKGALVLVPEISLTAQTVGRFRSRFGDDVAVLHSRLSTGERFDQWDLVRTGGARVVVGARSALFAPLPNVGLVIVDEEHEGTYKQDSSPRYHARDVAAKLAELRGCPLVLGSATPSLESLHRCEVGSWRGVPWTRAEMPERPGQAVLPEVAVVDMTAEFHGGNRSIFSRRLREGLERVARDREKAVLMLNRRGFAPFLMCRDCGCVPTCDHCSTALTYHDRTRTLECHTCGRTWHVRAYPDPSTKCPSCGSRYLAQMGVGTERVEDELRAILPEGVDVIRMDADTTKGKGAHTELLERFDASECAVLVGTQMIAKGLDFPEVTLVGVVNADITLKLPDFRAAERTYDLLEQVAGRAGRGKCAGEVIVQTYLPAHPAIRSVAAHDRRIFLDAELAMREEAFYPPFSRLANVTLWGRDATAVERASSAFAAEVRADVGDDDGWEVLGPAECVKARVKDRVRRHLLVKAPMDAALGERLRACAARIPKQVGISMAMDIDAYDMM